MTAYQAILAEARALANNEAIPVEQRREELKNLRDDLQVLIDDVEKQ
jgi:hypothetical protein